MKLPYSPKVTSDPDAQSANNLLNDVHRASITGSWLLQLYRQRFGSSKTEFRLWVKEHLDRDIQSIIRSMVLAQHADELKRARICRLSDAYRLLNLNHVVTMDRLDSPPD